MYEEHGYQRSGKKCREKFENLYKYYKKTKEGKAGRQDGKHYRFFRQLEALYGDNTPPNIPTSETHLIGNNFHFHNPNNSNIPQPNQESFFQPPRHRDSHSHSHSHSHSLSNNSSELDTSSSDGYGTNNKKKRGGRRSWKSKIKDFIDVQMRKLMEKQEEWLEKMTKTLDKKEQERVVREEEWRKQERERAEAEHRFWANERAWIEARDAALMEALHKLTDKEGVNGSETISNAHWRGECWPESEVTNKKRKENYSRGSCYNYLGSEGFFNQGEGRGFNCEIANEQRPEIITRVVASDHGSSTPNSNTGNAIPDSCFRFLIGGSGDEHGDNLWENYGQVKLGKGGN